jgi:hypothetical protein
VSRVFSGGRWRQIAFQKEKEAIKAKALNMKGRDEEFFMNTHITNPHIHSHESPYLKVVVISILQIRKWKLSKVKMKELNDLLKITKRLGNRTLISKSKPTHRALPKHMACNKPSISSCYCRYQYRTAKASMLVCPSKIEWCRR